MAWNNNAGGPWGGRNNDRGGGRNPWGGGGDNNSTPPDFEEIIRRGQDRFRRVMPGHFGGKRFAAILVVALAAIWLATGFYSIDANERGVVTIFGKYSDTTSPGLNYVWPYPVGRVEKVAVTSVRSADIGLQTPTAPRSSIPGSATNQTLMLTGDENLIDVGLKAQWVVNGDKVENFAFNVKDPEATVQNAVASAVREIVGRTPFERIRTAGDTVRPAALSLPSAAALDASNTAAQPTGEARNIDQPSNSASSSLGSAEGVSIPIIDVQGQILQLAQQILDNYNAGITITNLSVERAEPPADVLKAFLDVQAARADKERLINEAQGYYNEVTQQAEGQAARILRDAEAYRAEKVSLATGQAQRFLSIYNEYKQSKDVTRQRIYLETMEKIFRNMEKVLIEEEAGTGGGAVPYISLNELIRQRSTSTPGNSNPNGEAAPSPQNSTPGGGQ